MTVSTTREPPVPSLQVWKRSSVMTVLCRLCNAFVAPLPLQQLLSGLPLNLTLSSLISLLLEQCMELMLRSSMVLRGLTMVKKHGLPFISLERAPFGFSEICQNAGFSLCQQSRLLQVIDPLLNPWLLCLSLMLLQRPVQKQSLPRLDPLLLTLLPLQVAPH